MWVYAHAADGEAADFYVDFVRVWGSCLHQFWRGMGPVGMLHGCARHAVLSIQCYVLTGF